MLIFSRISTPISTTCEMGSFAHTTIPRDREAMSRLLARITCRCILKRESAGSPGPDRGVNKYSNPASQTAVERPLTRPSGDLRSLTIYETTTLNGDRSNRLTTRTAVVISSTIMSTSVSRYDRSVSYQTVTALRLFITPPRQGLLILLI